jgi:hypothetical protein
MVSFTNHRQMGRRMKTMPMAIMTVTCLAPDYNLSEKDIEQFLDEMADYLEIFESAIQRVEQLERSKVYPRGLLGDAVRRNAEQMVLGLGKCAEYAILCKIAIYEQHHSTMMDLAKFLG